MITIILVLYLTLPTKLSLIGPRRLSRTNVGAPQCLTFTRPDISFVVKKICPYMHDLRETYLNTLSAFLGTFIPILNTIFIYMSPHLRPSPFTPTHTIHYGGCPATRCSNSRYYVNLGNNHVSWSLKTTI